MKEVIKWVEDYETVDPARLIIRCKNCKRWGTDNDSYSRFKTCKRTGRIEPEDGFCWLPLEKGKNDKTY